MEEYKPRDNAFFEMCMQTPEERKNRILLPKYGKSPGDALDWRTDQRTSTRACSQCKKNGFLNYERRPSRLAQYLETCVACGARIGDS